MCPNKHCHKNKLHRSHQASCKHSIFRFAQNRLLLTHLLLPHIHHEIALLFVAEPPQNAQLHQIRHHRGFPPIFPLYPIQHFPRETLPGSFPHQMMQRRKNRGRSGIEGSCESKTKRGNKRGNGSTTACVTSKRDTVPSNNKIYKIVPIFGVEQNHRTDY